MTQQVPVRDTSLWIHGPGDWLSDYLLRHGDFYEAAILDGVDVPPGKVIDVGAMIGNHSVFWATRGHPVTAFEPFPVNYRLLARNAAGRDIHPMPFAVSSESGRVRMRAPTHNLGHAHVVARDESSPIEAVTLDAFDFRGVALIKVDVEGHEHHVLDGARETIDRERPLILIEDWPGEGYPVLDELGYAVVAEWATAHQTFLYGPVQ